MLPMKSGWNCPVCRDVERLGVGVGVMIRLDLRLIWGRAVGEGVLRSRGLLMSATLFGQSWWL